MGRRFLDGGWVMNALPRGYFHRLIVSLVLIFAGAFPLLVRANVNVLYRFDTRPPAEVFAGGFTPRGGNSNLVLHVLTVPEQSAFISTTSSYMAALRFAREYLEHAQDPNAVAYVYGISANADFYPVTSSLEGFLRQERRRPAAERLEGMEAHVELAIRDFEWQQEYVTVTPIEPSSIFVGVEFRRIPDSFGGYLVHQGDLRHNPAASGERNTFANTHPYPMAWPSAAHGSAPHGSPPAFAPASSCEDVGADASGAMGVSCEDDLYGVESGGEHISLGMFPPCGVAYEKKRGAGVPACFRSWRLVNLSKLARVMPEAISDIEAPADWYRDYWQWWPRDDL